MQREYAIKTSFGKRATERHVAGLVNAAANRLERRIEQAERGLRSADPEKRKAAEDAMPELRERQKRMLGVMKSVLKMKEK